ncbi:MAG TPA: bifunctional glutamate N-acetyltransferase/amino-acid acetyltransferase ArgJ [Clostridiaceae bacterium]|nr:bifunctional glutamate N-acetyltransferase/amino-acid acetyltransferase ArgJ [Clostridiaceae bacterium]
MIKSGVTAPEGFRASGVACGLKKNGNLDLAMVVSDKTAAAAGIFTANVVKGHSLKWTMEKVKSGAARAVVINSGCANACLGERGDADAASMAAYASGFIGCEPDLVLLGSTGVIGFPLDMKKIKAGIRKAYDSLSYEGGSLASKAIMTTDTYPKEAAGTFMIGDKTVTIGGMAKGSGMIHPNMATMISVITTDIAINPELLKKALKTAADSSFNRISVDGDTSVCDKVIILANGMAGNTVIDKEGPEYDAFLSVLLEVSESLAKMLAKDGEGATKLVEIRVKNCSDRESAHLILNAIAKSPLVKTAIFGQDANWGRIFTAAGYSGAKFDPDKVDIFIGDLLVCRNGTGLCFDEDKAAELLKKDEVVITLDFKDGSIDDRIWTCDFSYDYVRINGSYRS